MNQLNINYVNCKLFLKILLKVIFYNFLNFKINVFFPASLSLFLIKFEKIYIFI